MRRPETYEPLVAGVDAVVHAAQERSEGRWTRRRIAAMHSSDALMARALARACLAQGKPLVYSSGALTHPSRGDEWTDETRPPTPCLLARGHAEMESELSTLHREKGLRLIVISPGFIYGPGGLMGTMSTLLRAGKYRIIGDGQNYWSVVHVDDVAAAYVLALEQGAYGESFFLGDDVPLRRREMIDRLADGLGVARPKLLPSWLSGLLFGFPVVEAVSASLRLKNDKAKRKLGWTPSYATFTEGLPAVLQAIQRTGS
jgi:nucleoside-diphosphate-sugar epimerase